MSKTTKIIAALGVVAGLGVAALPAFTYATQEVSGNADIYVELGSAIAMTIVGNNDDTDGAGTASEQQYTTDPVTAGVGVSAPAGASAIDTYIPSTMDITNGRSSSYVSMLPNASTHGSDGNGFKSTITVFTNDSGYTLTIGALSALVNQKSGSTAEIPATGIVKAGTAGWGYAVDTAVTTDATGTPLEANYAVAADTIKDGSGPTDNGDETIVYYGVSTDADQETGVYKATVTYTATTAN
jgi:hypothetical protein